MLLRHRINIMFLFLWMLACTVIAQQGTAEETRNSCHNELNQHELDTAAEDEGSIAEEPKTSPIDNEQQDSYGDNDQVSTKNTNQESNTSSSPDATDDDAPNVPEPGATSPDTDQSTSPDSSTPSDKSMESQSTTNDDMVQGDKSDDNDISSIPSLSDQDNIPDVNNQSSLPPKANVSESTCTALKQLYSGLNGKSWVISTGWSNGNMTSCCDGWYGVTCIHGAVTKMYDKQKDYLAFNP